VLQIKGDTVNNALFRAELKKELTFFRGCSAVHIQNGADTAEVVTEGKTKKLASFLEWLSALSLSVSQRRPSFQGPSLVVYIQTAEWLDFKGDLRGFQAVADVPILYSRQESQLVDDGVSVIEAKSMTGTDESV